MGIPYRARILFPVHDAIGLLLPLSITVWIRLHQLPPEDPQAEMLEDLENRPSSSPILSVK
jgi:hypothetical protein